MPGQGGTGGRHGRLSGYLLDAARGSRLVRRYVDWNWSWNVDSAMRYMPAVEYVREKRPGLVLDVGSSGNGISSYCDCKSVELDLSFDASKPTRAWRRVAGSGVALPFADGAFDLVLCVDMIEHVPVDVRPGVVGELFRVAKPGGAVMVIAPCGRESGEAEKRVNEAYIRTKGRQVAFLKEHKEHGLPEAAGLLELVRDGARSRGVSVDAEASPNTPLRIWEWMARWFMVEGVVPGLGMAQRPILSPVMPLLLRMKGGPYYRVCIKASLDGGRT